MTFLDHLTVSGVSVCLLYHIIPLKLICFTFKTSQNVHFAKEVVLRGTVIVVASEGERIDIPRGAILENAVVTGNLRSKCNVGGVGEWRVRGGDIGILLSNLH